MAGGGQIKSKHGYLADRIGKAGILTGRAGSGAVQRGWWKDWLAMGIGHGLQARLRANRDGGSLKAILTWINVDLSSYYTFNASHCIG